MSELAYQTCGACDHSWWLTRASCPRCGTAEPREERASGRGTLHAVTTVHLTPDPDLKPLVPFRIALVDLVEGPRVMAHLRGAGEIGDAVTGALRMVGGRELPVFEPAGTEPVAGTA